YSCGLKGRDRQDVDKAIVILHFRRVVVMLSLPRRGNSDRTFFSFTNARPANPASDFFSYVDFDSPSPGKERAGVRFCLLALAIRKLLLAIALTRLALAF